MMPITATTIVNAPRIEYKRTFRAITAVSLSTYPRKESYMGNLDHEMWVMFVWLREQTLKLPDIFGAEILLAFLYDF